jgi:hypothetical protein
MKKVFLLGLLISIMAVSAAVLGEMTFTGDIYGKTSGSKKTGTFQLGVNKLDVNGKTIDGVFTNNTTTPCTAIIPSGEYWTYGWINFEEPRVGNTGKVTAVVIRFLEENKPSSAMWNYTINARTVNDPNCYVYRESKNKYEFSCNSELYTSAYVRPYGAFCASDILLWNFDAELLV